MRHLKVGILSGLLALLVISGLSILPARAGDRLLTVNNGSENDVWFIKGEKSLVMNGFDLTPMQVLQPATLDRVTITVDTPVPDQTTTIVVYQDANGGSPVDARLVGQQDVTITSRGSVTITLAKPVTITAPVVWVGFYLPVGFKFLADKSGPSVLTYWAWTAGGTFDLANLSSAQVLGPSDGSAPVGLNLNGKARITAEITGANPLLGTPVVMQAYQAQGNPNFNKANMVAYPDCLHLFHDLADEFDTYHDSVDIYCRELQLWDAPATPPGYEQRGRMFDVTMFTGNGVQANNFQFPVTHCIEANQDYLDVGLVGVAYGSPRVWRLLPTARFDNLICAELPHGGTVTYFIPLDKK